MSGIIGREAQPSTQLSSVDGNSIDGGTDIAVVIAVRVGGVDEDGTGDGGRIGTVEGVSGTISEVAAAFSLQEVFSCQAKEFPARKARSHTSAKLRYSELAVC